MKRSELSRYFAKIGAKGGAAGRGTPLRRMLNKQAAQIRWAKSKNSSATGGDTKAR